MIFKTIREAKDIRVSEGQGEQREACVLADLSCSLFLTPAFSVDDGAAR